MYLPQSNSKQCGFLTRKTVQYTAEIVLVSKASEMGAREVDVALCSGGGHSTVGARHAGGHRLGNSAAAVANTKLVGANADNSTIVGARSAVGRTLSRSASGRSGRLSSWGLWGRGRSRSEDTTGAG